LIFHLNYLEDCLYLPEFIKNELRDIGMDTENSVIVVTGDHGTAQFSDILEIHSKVNKVINYYNVVNPANLRPVPHDLHLSEENLRVATYISCPGSKWDIFNDLTSGMDLAPTVLAAMGFDPGKELPYQCLQI